MRMFCASYQVREWKEISSDKKQITTKQRHDCLNDYTSMPFCISSVSRRIVWSQILYDNPRKSRSGNRLQTPTSRCCCSRSLFFYIEISQYMNSPRDLNILFWQADLFGLRIQTCLGVYFDARPFHLEWYILYQSIWYTYKAFHSRQFSWNQVQTLPDSSASLDTPTLNLQLKLLLRRFAQLTCRATLPCSVSACSKKGWSLIPALHANPSDPPPLQIDESQWSCLLLERDLNGFAGL